MKIFEFTETCIVNSSTKYHCFLMYRTKAIRKRTMVTDFHTQLTVYIHPKTLRFSALFWMGRVPHICLLWKNYSLENVDIYTHKTFSFGLQNDTKMKRVRHLCAPNVIILYYTQRFIKVRFYPYQRPNEGICQIYRAKYYNCQ